MEVDEKLVKTVGDAMSQHFEKTTEIDRELVDQVTDALVEHCSHLFGRAVDDEVRREVTKSAENLLRGMPRRDFVVKKVEVDPKNFEVTVHIAERGSAKEE